MKIRKITAILLAVATAVSLGGMNTASSVNLSKMGTVNVEQECDMKFFPFIYSDDADFSWHRDFIGNCDDCIPGYLYVQDLETKEVWQVLNQNVDCFISHEKMLYCITNGTTVVQTDYQGTEIKDLYFSVYGNLNNISLDSNALLLTDGNHVIRIDFDTGVVTNLAECKDIINIVPVSADCFAWTNKSYETYLHNIETGTEEAIDLTDLDRSETVQHNTELTLPGVEVYDFSESTQETLPLSDYPSGSYFTKNGKACTDHGGSLGNPCLLDNSCNCLMHEYSIQCTGFAKYAFERYSHVSSWIPRSDTAHREMNISIKTAESLLVFLRTTEVGSYLRLMRADKPNAPEGHHSIIVAGYNSDSITVYDCNWTGACKVSYRTISLTDFVKKFDEIVSCVAHDYSGSILKDSSMYHQVRCSYSGCGGYVLRPHVTNNPGENATCIDCGYVGPIMGIIMSAGCAEQGGMLP